MNDFVHLHVHTEYSLLDGAAKLDSLLDRALQLGQKAIAITDHGAMYGVAEFYKKAVARGIKPVLGCEVYVAPRSMLMKEHNVDGRYSHLVLLAKNDVGYHNLMKIVSDAFVYGYYYKPRTDIDQLRKYSDGIIALSGCLAGDIQRMLINGDYDGAVSLALEYKAIFTDGFYLELQNHFLDEDNTVINGLTRISEQTGIPLVATNDTHYILKEDAYLQRVLMCISMNKSIDEDNPLAFKTDEFYLKSFDEMNELFGNNSEALRNTVKIADECNVTLDFKSMHLPKYKLPDGTDSFARLSELCYAGLEKRYGDRRYSQRLDYELSVIRDMHFIDYFLIVADFVNHSRKKGIAIGPGRGSATGSMVSYCLGITDIDPMEFGLIFERFLNPSRASMPDIDIDFCVERRQEVLSYLVSRYGTGHVSQIITFGTLAARAAIKDVGRVLGVSFSTVESVSKHFSSKAGASIKSVLETDDDLANRYRNNDEIKKLIDTAIMVEGFPRHGSTHAAGVVITDGPVSDYIPLARNDDVIVTQFQKNEVEQLGLLKIDLLGLRNITVIDKTQKLIRESDKNFDIRKIPKDDKKTFELIASGNTFGVFQLESPGMRKLLMKLNPCSIDDIITAVSLYRPGPMDSIPKYLENRKAPDKIKYSTPKLRPILEGTYGCIVYQEQVMQIARDIAGYTYGHADVLRAAMSKKKTEVMADERKLFIAGAVKNGVSKSIATKIFDDMSEFARYGFNKSHAAGYALIAYETAFLKANYPAVFMASLLTSVIYSTPKIKEYIGECGRLGVNVYPPDINLSRQEFVADGQGIYYGLGAVKNVGYKLIEASDAERDKNGKYKSYVDFLSRLSGADLNRRAIESLVKCGAFDSFGYSRRHMLSVYDRILDAVTAEKSLANENQVSFFGGEDDADFNFDYFSNPLDEFDMQKKLALEKDSLGLYLSEHPLRRMEPVYENGKYNSASDILAGRIKDENVKILGLVDSVRIVTTKQLSEMAYVSVEDNTDTIDCVVFPRQFDSYKTQIDAGTLIEMEGRLSEKDDVKQIVCQKIKFPNAEKLLERYKVLYLKFVSSTSPAYEKSIRLLKEYPGENTCVFYFSDTGRSVTTKGKMAVKPEYSLVKELSELLGEENIIIK